MTTPPPFDHPSPTSDLDHAAPRRRNRKKKQSGLTAAGLAKLRATALKNQPWKHSTGPRTPEGKARSAANGYRADAASEIVAQLVELQRLTVSMAGLRREMQADHSR